MGEPLTPLCGVLEYLKPLRQPISIRIVIGSARKVKLSSVKWFERLQHLAIVLMEKPVRNVDAIVGIDADEVSIEGGVMNPGKRQSIRYNGLSIGP